MSTIINRMVIRMMRSPLDYSDFPDDVLQAIARECLDEMREPTLEMIAAGELNKEKTVNEIWTAMIDEASK